ncbi:hypothetical protein K488DRAFT_83491 [Vararia minispora EC-137]|uniref:Uncharacterized protein n=1 Tax=Vararia minispora EC-137 TaxID=1314806 RepID=A0ACB8QT69_9AGAM|nr:hypothetical protein K488DRAFT_83491 [Vararia minispora EC-137]
MSDVGSPSEFPPPPYSGHLLAHYTAAHDKSNARDTFTVVTPLAHKARITDAEEQAEAVLDTAHAETSLSWDHDEAEQARTSPLPARPYRITLTIRGASMGALRIEVAALLLWVFLLGALSALAVVAGAQVVGLLMVRLLTEV